MSLIKVKLLNRVGVSSAGMKGEASHRNPLLHLLD